MAPGEGDGAGDSSAVPRLKGQLDFSQAKLSAEEGFLLSRIDGRATIASLIQSCGLGQERTRQLLDGLRDRGLLDWDEGEAGSPPTGGEDEATEPWNGMRFDPFDLAEEVDLDERTKRKILYLFSLRDELTHYQILGVARQADAKEIKRAYFQVSKDFHPDSYFRKNLGSYKTRVEALFKRVNAAYEVLSDPQRRSAYETTLPYEASPEEIAAQQAKEVQLQRDERMREERRQRLLRRSPVTQRKAKAREYFEEARQAREKNNAVLAANKVRLALTFDPQNEEYKKLLEEVEGKAGAVRSEREFKRGRYEESIGREEEALSAYLAAIEVNPSDTRSLARAAALMLSLKRDLRQALSLARRAQQQSPEDADITRTVGELFDAQGMHKNALREYRRLLELKPLDERARTRVRELQKLLR